MEDTNTSKKFYKRWWFWVVVVFVFLAIAGSGEKQKATEPTNTATPAVTQESVISVAASELMRDYDANEVAADAKYKDKVIQTSGTITSIGKDILDTPYITLSSGGNSFSSVQCMFEKSDQAELAALAKNTKITLQGRVSGKTLGNVLIRECSVVK